MKSPRCLPTFSSVALIVTCIFAGWLPANAWSGPADADELNAQGSASSVVMPAPLRSFLRMAGISQKISPDEVVPLLAHNVFAQGYEGSRDGGRPTEFLILLSRYVHQARELAVLSGSDGSIRVSNCEDAQPLLHILGYRVRQDCGKRSTSLMTSDPERAFLTIDSGFPLPELEQTLQGRKPFVYPFPSSRVPVIFTERDWTILSKESKNSGDLLETLLRDPVVSRLYWAMARNHAETKI